VLSTRLDQRSLPEHQRPSAGIIPPLDVFVDLSACRTAGEPRKVLERLVGPDNLHTIARRVKIVVTPGTELDGRPPGQSGWVIEESASPLVALAGAVATSGGDDTELMVLIGPVDVNSEAVGIMRRCLERDPMLGFAVPRVRCANGCCFARLSPHGVGVTEMLPRRVLAEVPDSEFFADVVSPCMLVRAQVLGNFVLSGRFESTAAAMLHYMATARRAGFRTVVCNRAVVGVDGLTCQEGVVRPMPELSEADQALLDQAVPDLERSWVELRAGSWERFEKLSAASVGRHSPARPPSLLLDVRNVTQIYNGTTQAVLSLLKALKELEPKWEISVLATQAGASFHNLSQAHAAWPLYTTLPDRSFTATLRPSQPWHVQEMVDLHNLSLFNAYLVLDTIAWDIVYSAPRRLEGVWRFLSDHADALLFDSDFTRRRFIERFPVESSVPNLVTHFSFDPREYILSEATTKALEEFILVVGNDLDHKDVRNTVEALASAFPFWRIKAIGPANAPSSFVDAHRSGELPELDLHRLYANARFVVFPSFYEGFGFPVLTALSYGRTVLARGSSLLDEVAAQCDRRGQLVVFDRREQLVELMGRLMHGESVPTHPLGSARANGRPRCWRDVAGDILEFLEQLVSEPAKSRWNAREHVVSQLLAYRN
jgi:glycosyltransferase involved in cell wall biosynthesis